MVRAGRVTLRDVADRVGLSANTVSRALSGKDQVSEATRELIVAEARRLGYVPHSQARSPVPGTTAVLALVITDPSNPFHAALISAVERQCRLAGYSVLLLVTEENEDNEARAVRQLLKFGVDGVLAVPSRHRPGVWAELSDAGLPVVLLGRDLPELGFDFVGIDVERAVTDAVTRVAGPDPRRAWLFDEDLEISTVAAGFRRALGDDSLVLKVPGHRTRDATLPDDAYRLAAGLITREHHPELVVTGTDYFALGVYKAVRERGLTVGEDVRVLGYGDHPFAAYLEPGLTTIRLPADEVGAAGVDLVLRRLAEPARPREAVLLNATLIERDSARFQR
ncbi:LacI family DNA-binding transcriptional regulator [Amycolatopsis magusensis]|uniref:LacI family transcriptional regulator n=1 Tax=Amycolatopsis magusensis TaxID=882444 RepID=A0ABS4PYE0_9PSEU|nr:LacI family DNA-binding transcriptional regulator [Amycolatopsis magusensis]MBP2184446.1 LacI family transcriptional regulator [Amycolatopsis magusensis]